MHLGKPKAGLINKMSLNEALANVEKEGEVDPFNKLDKAEETAPESLPENKQGEVKPEEGDNTPKEEENIPFHKHPRWIERENEFKTLKEREAEKDQKIAELMEFKTKFEQNGSNHNGSSNIPKWFSTLYGENPEAWEAYSEYDKSLREEIKREVIETQAQERQQALEEERKWDTWVQSELGKLEAEGMKFDRNELIKTMLEYRPSDEHGNFDFKAGYRIYDALKTREADPANKQARKIIADAATKSSKGDRNTKTYLTNNDLRGKSWHTL